MMPLQLSLNLINDKRQFVIRRKSPKQWFFCEIYEEYDTQPVIWTPHLLRACKFYTEEAVEEFKYAYLRSRPCEIIEIKGKR